MARTQLPVVAKISHGKLVNSGIAEGCDCVEIGILASSEIRFLPCMGDHEIAGIKSSSQNHLDSFVDSWACLYHHVF